MRPDTSTAPIFPATSLRWLLLFTLLLQALLGSACTDAAKPAEIRLGLLAPLGGADARFGEAMVNAAQLAVDEANAAGGLQIDGETYRITLIVRNDQNSPEVAAGAARQLITQDYVNAIIGPLFDHTAIPVSVVAEQAHIPMITPFSTAPATTSGKEYIFRATYTNELQGEVMARFAIEDLGAAGDQRGAAVIYDIANEYSRGVADRFKQAMDDAGVKVSIFESYTTGATDFSAQLSQVASGVNLLILPNYPNDVTVQVQQARQMGVFQTIICGDALSGIDPADYPALDRIFLTAPWHPDIVNPLSQTFIAAYRTAYGQEPTSIAALTYDSVNIVLQAIREQGRLEPSAIRDGLAGLARFEGVTGVIEYRGTGDPLKSVAVLQIFDGKFVFFKLFSP